MSLSTTTTASFILTKYSRSYSSPSSQNQPAPENEWQHFTNPIMKLRLDAKKSPPGELISLRMKILWNIEMQGSDIDVDQREVVFEDLELLAFSSLPTFRVPNNSDQGLPLKAVYRDAVVGIRYLHPKTILPGCAPAYRRFQITFINTAEASQFIDTVKPVCPCKANPQPNQVNRNLTMPPANLLARSATASTVAGTTIPSEPHMIQPNRTLFRPSYIHQNTSGNGLSALGKSGLPLATTTTPRQWISNPPFPPASMLDSSEDGSFVTCPEKTPRTSGNPSLPSSSQPCTSSYSSDMTRNVSRPNPSTPMIPEASVDTGKSGFLASLNDVSSLYSLSRADLERLVSQVVREEGFARLLDSLDSLWRGKGLLPR